MESAAKSVEELKSGVKEGTLIYLNKAGSREIAGNWDYVNFGTWNDKVWYKMAGVLDAPWTELCPLSSVVAFLQSNRHLNPKRR